MGTLTQFIIRLLYSNPAIFWSWGVEPESIQEITTGGVSFSVNGFKYQGTVEVRYNEGSDLFDLHLPGINKVIEGIYLDSLVSVIDEEVEKTENYDQRICEEYGIVT